MDTRKSILQELKKIEETQHVKILHAVESGSRAWGFASPDSDYDVRFVYVRPEKEYLRIDEIRDFIEWKLDEVLDINGWDLQKALKLIGQGNTTIFEWINSPAVYLTTEEWSLVRQTANEFFSEKVACYQYYGTAASTYEKYLTGDTVRYKKYLYALRPLLAANYIETYHHSPPVLFAELQKMPMTSELRAAIALLLKRKAVTTEMEKQPHIPEILSYIQKELVRQKERCNQMINDRRYNWERLNRCFANILQREKDQTP